MFLSFLHMTEQRNHNPHSRVPQGGIKGGLEMIGWKLGNQWSGVRILKHSMSFKQRANIAIV